jgi:hypothetical protein
MKISTSPGGVYIPHPKENDIFIHNPRTMEFEHLLQRIQIRGTLLRISTW